MYKERPFIYVLYTGKSIVHARTEDLTICDKWATMSLQHWLSSWQSTEEHFTMLMIRGFTLKSVCEWSVSVWPGRHSLSPYGRSPHTEGLKLMSKSYTSVSVIVFLWEGRCLNCWVAKTISQFGPLWQSAISNQCSITI